MKKPTQFAKGEVDSPRIDTPARLGDGVMDKARNERQKTVLLNTLRAYRVRDLSRTCQETEALVARTKELCNKQANALKQVPSPKAIKRNAPEVRERLKAG